MQKFVTFNDDIVDAEQALLRPTNRGFKFGDGIFESMRMCNGKIQFADAHADRLKAAMKVIKLDGYALFDEYFLRQKTEELARRNRFGANARFRLTVYREGEGLYTPASNKPGYLLEATALTSPTYELNQRGLIIDVYDEITKPINKLSNFKTTNALLYVMAGLFQKQHQLDEAMLLNQQGLLCESTSSNVFVVFEDQIYTPSLAEGCVAGVMRGAVLTLAKVHDIPVIEAQINPQILMQADEVFVTNAATGIRWVMGYGRKRYFNEVAKTLHAKLNEQIGS